MDAENFVASKFKKGEVDLQKLKAGTYTVIEIKTFLKKYKLNQTGNKCVLTNRLYNYIKNKNCRI